MTNIGMNILHFTNIFTVEHMRVFLVIVQLLIYRTAYSLVFIPAPVDPGDVRPLLEQAEQTRDAV